MGDLDADIAEFEEYDRIASDNGITDVKWARAAHTKQPRIAEMRQILRLVRDQGLTQDEASKRIKRSCTHIKLNKLFRALCDILGDDYMKQSLQKAIKKEKNPMTRLQYKLKGVHKDLYAELNKILDEKLSETEQLEQRDEARKAKKRPTK